MTNLERLDAYLSSDESPENSMLLSDLDGFLHGIACSPVLISSEEWMPVALGAPPEEVPEWVLMSIVSMYMAILEGLTKDPPEVEPVFWQAKEGHVIAVDWCEGFMDAVKLRADAWQEFMETDEGAGLMAPILMHILDDNGNSLFGVPQEELDEALAKAAEAVTIVVVAIFRRLSPE